MNRNRGRELMVNRKRGGEIERREGEWSNLVYYTCDITCI